MAYPFGPLALNGGATGPQAEAEIGRFAGLLDQAPREAEVLAEAGPTDDRPAAGIGVAWSVLAVGAVPTPEAGLAEGGAVDPAGMTAASPRHADAVPLSAGWLEAEVDRPLADPGVDLPEKAGDGGRARDRERFAGGDVRAGWPTPAGLDPPAWAPGRDVALIAAMPDVAGPDVPPGAVEAAGHGGAPGKRHEATAAAWQTASSAKAPVPDGQAQPRAVEGPGVDLAGTKAGAELPSGNNTGLPDAHPAGAEAMSLDGLAAAGPDGAAASVAVSEPRETRPKGLTVVPNAIPAVSPEPVGPDAVAPVALPATAEVASGPEARLPASGAERPRLAPDVPALTGEVADARENRLPATGAERLWLARLHLHDPRASETRGVHDGDSSPPPAKDAATKAPASPPPPASIAGGSTLPPSPGPELPAASQSVQGDLFVAQDAELAPLAWAPPGQSVPSATPGAAPMPQGALPQLAAGIAASLSQRTDGVTEIALSPDELGGVRLKLEADARDPDRMIVHLVFDRPETMELFRRHADQLTDAIRAAGYADARLDFGQSGTGPDPGNGHGPAHDGAGPVATPKPGEAEPATSRPAPDQPFPLRRAETAGLDLRL